jgi:hypothetical protein
VVCFRQLKDVDEWMCNAENMYVYVAEHTYGMCDGIQWMLVTAHCKAEHYKLYTRAAAAAAVPPAGRAASSTLTGTSPASDQQDIAADVYVRYADAIVCVTNGWFVNGVSTQEFCWCSCFTKSSQCCHIMTLQTAVAKISTE